MRKRVTLAYLICLSMSFAVMAMPAGGAQTPTSPNETPAPLVNGAGAAGGTERPFDGNCQTEFEVLTSSPPETELPPSTAGLTTKAIIRITGRCTLTHLGHATTDALQRLEGPPETPPELVTKLQNIGSYTAANGDRMHFGMTGEVMQGDAVWPVHFRGTATFRGGTGRFITATGSTPFGGGARFQSSTTGVGYFFHSGGTISY